MSLPIDQKERQIVPRWHSARVAAERGELKAIRTPNPTSLAQQPALLREKLLDWQEHRSASFAADLVATAFLMGETEEARDAATYLVSPESNASESARVLATRLLHPDEVGLQEEGLAEPTSSASMSRSRIKELKRMLRNGPRNALAWADLSFEYAKVALTEKAVHAMEVALRLVPDSRFLLRSSARLFLHAEDPERALHLLRGAPALGEDPWLMAAEIAVAGVVRRSPRTARRGRALLQREVLAASQTTELAAALATLEASSGDNRSARKLFAQSLIDPNENAVAQARWASHQLKLMKLEARHLSVPASFEARARDALISGRFGEGLHAAWEWLHDQPFSRDPAVFGSYLASVALRDYTKAIEIIAAGRVANPKDWLLLSNTVFALASLDRVDEAQEVFALLRPDPADRPRFAVWHANDGLLKFRTGLTEAGRAQYKTAVDVLVRGSFKLAAAVAAVFHAREELRARRPEAREAVEQATKLARLAASPETDSWVTDLQRALVNQGPTPE